MFSCWFEDGCFTLFALVCIIISLGIVHHLWLHFPKVQMTNKKAIFITGCDSGFGYSLALHCHQILGMTVLAGCFQPGGDTKGSKSLIEKSNGEIKVIPIDVTSTESIQKAVTMTKKLLIETDSELWCLVNNAAVLVFSEAEWQPMELVRRQFEVNTFGPLEVSKAFLPLLRKTSGRIVNMVSFCTDCALPTLSVYTATKAALKSLTNTMRMEMAKFDVKVILFNPGDHPMDTPLCSGQEVNYLKIDEEVKKIEDYNVFDEYYQNSRAKFTAIFEKPQLKKLEDEGLYLNFNRLVMAKNPMAEYVNSDIVTRTYFMILRLLPPFISDQMRLKLMNLPKFSKNN